MTVPAGRAHATAASGRRVVRGQRSRGVFLDLDASVLGFGIVGVSSRRRTCPDVRGSLVDRGSLDELLALVSVDARSRAWRVDHTVDPLGRVMALPENVKIFPTTAAPVRAVA
jgi:hypothetical protein